MIARVWKGIASAARADAYEAQLKPEPLPGLSKKDGYLGSLVLRHDNGDEVEFITILFWQSIDHIKAITGPDYERAVVPEERRPNLLRYDATAQHFEVRATSELSRLLSNAPSQPGV